MSQLQTTAVALLVCALAGSANCTAGDVDERKQRPANKSKTATFSAVEKRPTVEAVEKSMLPVYHPPLRGAPAGRAGAATRRLSLSDIVLVPFAPNHTGLTVNEQPNIYWYQSKPAAARMVFTLRAEEMIEPLAEVNLGEALRPGIHRLRLSDHGLRLQAAVNYEWFVTIMPNDKQQSYNLLARGVIRFTRPWPALVTSLQKANPRQMPRVYAWEGIWYDAIDSVSYLIDEHPDDPQLRSQRVALLDQVGICDAAMFDKPSKFIER